MPCPGGVCALSGGVVSGSGGCVSGPGGSALGGVCLVRGGVLPLPQYLVGYHPLPPMNIMTNRCKNITLATTSLRPVIICPNKSSNVAYHSFR